MNKTALCGILLCLAGSACADTGGRLLATGGVTNIEGSAGGGIVPWAVLSGYGTRDEWGGDAFATRVRLARRWHSTTGWSCRWRASGWTWMR